jgi:heme A synthase
MTWFQRLLLVTIITTFVLVAVGGTVRATDSGLGCPDWPTCHGKIIPDAEYHTLIEFSHRTVAAVVGLLFLGVTFFAFKTERRNRLVFWLAFAAGLLLLWQIILGGITVVNELPPEVVALHLATAMTFMAVTISALIISIMRSHGHAADTRGTDDRFIRVALIAAATSFATLVLGSYISGTEASLACSGWPLCNGSLVPGGDSHVGLHYTHRVIAGVLGLQMLLLVYLAVEGRSNQPLVLRLTVLAAVTYVVQALVGAANIWTDVASAVVIAHLTLAAALWCMLVAISALAFYLPGRQGRTLGRSPDAHTKEAEWAR